MINFKEAPIVALHGLDTALKVEKQKYGRRPIKADLAASYELYQAWGYVVCGYFLLEQTLKLLLHLRGKSPDKIHVLSELYRQLSADDQAILDTYFCDFKPFCGYSFEFASLEEFLVNLDGVESKGKLVGALDWRYYLIEEPKAIPRVGIEFIHEATFGGLRIITFVINGEFDPLQYTYKVRRNWESTIF